MRRLSRRLVLAACAVLALSCDGTPLGHMPLNEPFASISAAGHTTCALTTGGEGFCWGRGTDGQLGNGGRETMNAPVPVKGGRRFASLSTGYYHACALTAEGRAWCWGATRDADNAGQLGNGSTRSGSTEPARVRTDLKFRSIASGQLHTCALTAQGQAYCWGDNYWGQLGDGTTRTRTTPVPVAGSHRFVTLSAGATHTCGASAAGEALCWGDNFFGGVTGNALAHTPDTCGAGGDPRCTLAPHIVALGAPVDSVSAGYAGTCALGRGTWYCWGGNIREPSPPRVMRSSGLASLATGASHWCAVGTDGAAYCGGANNLGQLGSGDGASFAPTPVAVAGGLSFRSIASGMFHTCGVSTDGFAWCWGANHDEALGGAGTPTTCDAEPCRRIPGRVRGQSGRNTD